jgi:hypothetical protein
LFDNLAFVEHDRLLSLQEWVNKRCAMMILGTATHQHFERFLNEFSLSLLE